MIRALALTALALVTLPAAASAQLAQTIAPRPGTYLWADTPGRAGDVSIVVDRARQVAAVYRGAALIAITSVSTGKPGHGTPAGAFTILEKAVHHRSNLYSNAPMPYMQRLTWGGIAIHAGHNPGRPASHGCIRVPLAFARLLFAATRLGATVRIGDTALPGLWEEVDMTRLPPLPGWAEQSQDDYVSWGSALRR